LFILVIGVPPLRFAVLIFNSFIRVIIAPLGLARGDAPGLPGAMPLAILISPRWGLPGAMPLAILISPRWGFFSLNPF